MKTKTYIVEMTEGWEPGNCGDIVPEGVIRICPIMCNMEGCFDRKMCPLANAKKAVEVRARADLESAFYVGDKNDPGVNLLNGKPVKLWATEA